MKQYILVSIALFAASCDTTELRDPTDVVNSEEVIKLVVVDENYNELSGKQILLADCTSVCFLKAVLRNHSDNAKEIVFSTTAGVLTNVGHLPTSESQSTLSLIPADRELIVQLNSLDIINNNVTVSATTEKISDVIQLSFDTSYPHDMQVTPSSISVAKTEDVEIDIHALVTNGTMSEGQYVKLQANMEGDAALQFPEFVKITNQKAKVTISNPSQMEGKATLTIEMSIASDKTIKKQVLIDYK